MVSEVFEGLVRYVRHSPSLTLSFQIVSWVLRILFSFNVARSLLPLVRPKGKPLTTIPLTPAQRDLIGLEKNGPSRAPPNPPPPYHHKVFLTSLGEADITPMASTQDTITPPRYKASPSGSGSSPKFPPKPDSPVSVSFSTPTPAQKAFSSTSSSSSLRNYSSPIQQRNRSSSPLLGRKFAAGVGGHPLGLGSSPLSGGVSGGMLDSPSARKASMEVFFQG
jgi:hypothetical protein